MTTSYNYQYSFNINQHFSLTLAANCFLSTQSGGGRLTGISCTH